MHDTATNAYPVASLRSVPCSLAISLENSHFHENSQNPIFPSPLPLPLPLRHLPNNDFPPTPSLDRPTPIISLTNRHTHPPPIPTKPQTRHAPAPLGIIILDSLSRDGVPYRDTPVAAARGKGAVDGVPC